MPICADCGLETTDTAWCVRCGHRRDGEPRSALRRRFRAQPDEPAIALHVISTLFPRLPREDLGTFRLALFLGAATVVVLGAAGLFPVALVAAAVLVPLLLLVYLRAVDVYEEEPWSVLGFTFAWGIFFGTVTGLVLSAAITVDPLAPDRDLAYLAARGAIVPLIAGGLMLVGPLLLLSRRRFADVLDGATFGAVAASTFVGAQVVAQSLDFLGVSLQPGGSVTLWVARLLTQGVALPLLAGGAIGAACGSFWLRYRAPAADRERLGSLGHPGVALLGAAVLLVVGELARLVLSVVPALVVCLVLAAIALTWLRIVVHLGLLEEGAGIPIGPPIRCANCGRMTPRHTFCGECGVALRALPKSRPTVKVELVGPATSDPSPDPSTS